MSRYLIPLLLLISCTARAVGAADPARNFGYLVRPAAELARQQQLIGAPRTSLSGAPDDDGDRYLYRPLVQLLSELPGGQKWLRDRGGVPCLRSYNQGNIGSCVGNATALCVSVRAAWEIVEDGEDEELVAMAAADGLYGLAREACGLVGSRFDGATGYGAALAIRNFGTLWQLQYADTDLSCYNVDQCRQFGLYGVGGGLKDKAAEHPVVSTFAIETFDQAWAALGRGVPINVCSDVGFNSRRDATGTCQPSGHWGHSMAVIGRRTLPGHRRQVLIMNSWGDDWNSGDYVDDMPFGSFWIDEPVFTRMIAQRDSYGYELLEGFQCELNQNLIWIKF